MFSVWFVGFLAYIVYRVFNAGMNSSNLFYNPKGRYDSGPTFSEDKVAFYIFKTIVAALFWPFVLPTVGVYKLGKRFNKDTAA